MKEFAWSKDLLIDPILYICQCRRTSIMERKLLAASELDVVPESIIPYFNSRALTVSDNPFDDLRHVVTTVGSVFVF